MDIWHYSSDDGRLLGQGSADPDPLSPDNWLLPAWTTTVEPPPIAENESAYFDGSSWRVLPVEAPNADA